MGINCYSGVKIANESQKVDIVEKVRVFIKTNNFYYTTASKIITYGEEALKIQSDEDLELFLFNIIDQKEILTLLVVTIKKINF